jgi:chemotaxis protein MotB
MTLLFALSVTMYAAAADSAATQRGPRDQGSGIGDQESGIGDQGSGIGLSRRLERDLAEAIGAGRVELIDDVRGLVVSMPDDAAFPIGSADATADARRLIGRVGETLRSVPNRIRIEGHTDDVPIRTARYASNWELSTARASAVVGFLITEAGIDPRRLSAAGYGEFHPLNPNDTGPRRARNRRVDVVILDHGEAQDAVAEGEGLDAVP